MSLGFRRLSFLGVWSWICLAGGTLAADAPSEEKIDWTRARQLHQREQNGERLTGDDAAYLKHAKEIRQKNLADGKSPEGGPAGEKARAGVPDQPPRDSTGLVPLTQVSADQQYKGEAGGLYGAGSNEPPAAHLKAALSEAAKIAPLGRDGKASAGGKIVLLSIGMSNTTQEFARFKQIADADPAKSPRVELIDGAQGGKEASAWSGSDPDRAQGVWETVDNLLLRMDVSPEQVQVLWIKQARANPATLGEYPKHAQVMDEDLTLCLNRARRKWPNVRLAYLSSRIYAGYATTGLNPEPYAYEGGFAVRSLIASQINGSPRLNYDPTRGAVTSPLLLWGPYLWADGVKGRSTDDLVWRREDLGPDGTHPSPAGREKVAQLLLKFFKTDPTAAPWFTVAGSK